ncbi:MAG: hypothetical protein M1833_007119 [Piccolia ochrophora]|nr:MAG: hypothetical protein M1833_007119 [Piccolia ochrophora]
MSAFLSLPLLSYLAIPSIGSYSTSINILFFYMTWSTLILSQPPLKVELLGTLMVRGFLFFLPSLWFLLFDTALPSLAVKIKTQGEAALPTRTVSASTPKKQILAWWKIIGVATGNLLLGVAIQAGVESASTLLLHRSALRTTTTLPSPWRIFLDVSRGFLAREVLQYCAHRYLLHSDSSGAARLTTQHRTWHHALTAPHSFVAHYDHPLPWLLWKFFPTYLPAVIFRFHLLNYFVFLALVTLEETFAFSGYSTVPSILLGGIAKRQDLHSRSGGEGNYGPWGVCDWGCGTSVGGVLGEDVAQELEKHGVGEKAAGAIEGAKGGAKKKKGKPS